MQIFKKLFFLLDLDERKNAGLLLIMVIVMALLDMIGVASILPFMAVLANPDLIDTNNILNTLFQISGRFGVETDQEFLFFLGILVFLILISSLTFKAITVFVQTRFVYMCEYRISKNLIEQYLYQPYIWFLSRHSADLGKTILSEVTQIIGKGIQPSIEIIAKGALIVSLIVLLVIVDPKILLIVGLSLGFTYLLIFYFARSYLSKIGRERFVNNQLRFTTVSEAFGAAKEVKIGRLEKIFIKKFSSSAIIFSKTQALSIVIAQLPRFLLEAVIFGGIILLILYKMVQEGNFNNSLPIISLYTFAGYRMMPALQQIYNSLTMLNFVSPSIDRLYTDLKNLKPYNKNQDQNILAFKEAIKLNHVSYNYPNTSRTALKDVNLNIPINSIIGLIGSTGSGKTTIIDIILGLLKPNKGNLEIDGKVITEQKARSWQRLIGYVPQHIYLSNDTIVSNIAFGVEPKDINQDRIKKVSKIANLHQFVVDELPEQYQTIIGERGVRLSGGQRQRIGIARALYHNPKVLILDEATSALDSHTEQQVMDAINNLSKDLTIIIIAHRVNTVKNCDIIYKIENGKIIEHGKFDKIIK